MLAYINPAEMEYFRAQEDLFSHTDPQELFHHHPRFKVRTTGAAQVLTSLPSPGPPIVAGCAVEPVLIRTHTGVMTC